VRLVAVVVVTGICLPWIVEYFTAYSEDLIRHIPRTIATPPVVP
jgi:flagellar biosynthesis protein FliQ